MFRMCNRETTKSITQKKCFFQCELKKLVHLVWIWFYWPRILEKENFVSRGRRDGGGGGEGKLVNYLLMIHQWKDRQ